MVTEDLMNAQIHRESAPALERIVHLNAPNTVDTQLMKHGTKVLVHYESSKHTEKNEWIEAVVQETEQHIVKCRK